MDFEGEIEADYDYDDVVDDVDEDMDDDEQDTENDAEKNDSDDDIGEDEIDDENIKIIDTNNYKLVNEGKITLKGKNIINYKCLSKFEITAIIGYRATQISEDADIYVTVPDNMCDPIQIAELEFSQNKIPFVIYREINSNKNNEIILVPYKL